MVLISLLIVSLASAYQTMEENPMITELETHRKLWQAQNITSYDYTFNKMCFCPPPANTPAIISVRNNAITSVSNPETSQPIDNPEIDFYKSIDQLFEVLEEAVQRKADRITVKYDAKLGYPTSIFIDYIKLAADDEVAFSATDLVVVEN